MTTIVIPDIHNHWGWIEPALEILKKKYNYDEVVFLGDYFDSFHDSAFMAQGTAMWLKKSVNEPDRIHLLGNHDMPYMHSNPCLYCPGFSQAKKNVINSNLTREDWDKFKPAYFTQDFLMSHAGFHPNLITHPVKGIPTPEELVGMADWGLNSIKTGIFHELFLPGSRMAEQRHGGITWQDWDDEFAPVDGVNQIVGHTPGREPRAIVNNLSKSYCIDARGEYIGVIIDGELSFEQRKNLKNEPAKE